MTRRGRAIFGAVLLGVLFLSDFGGRTIAAEEEAAAVDQSSSLVASVEDLKWMTGYWVGKSERVRMEEIWVEPRNGLMVGLHRDSFTSGGAFFEYLRIEGDEGKVIYWASPMGRSATPFTLTSVQEHEAVFENPDHDFPQKIIYSLQGNTLHASAEGLEGGKTRIARWSWTRSSLPGETKKGD